MANIPPYELSQEELELIEAYLQQQLSATEQQQVEDRIHTDVIFKAKVDEVRKLMTGIEEASLQNEIQSWHKELIPESNIEVPISIKPIPMIRRWWVAASILLILVAAAFWLWPMLKPTMSKQEFNAKLYKNYFTPDIGLPVTMGSKDSASYKFYDGMVNYKEGKYNAAYTKWEELARSTTHYSDTLVYYMGMALLNQDYTEAERWLIIIQDSTHSVFHQDANWYLGLIYLKQGDMNRAIEYLKKLPSKEEAIKLLKEIEMQRQREAEQQKKLNAMMDKLSDQKTNGGCLDIRDTTHSQ